jgi:hypothetical protein
MLRNPDRCEAAAKAYADTIPPFAARFAEVADASQLDDAYSAFTSAVLHPWHRTSRSRPSRYRFFWDRHLDALAASRSAAYREWKQHPSDAAWASYRQLDKAVKRAARSKKRALFTQFTTSLEKCPRSEASARINGLVSARHARATRHSLVGQVLNPADITRHLSSCSLGSPVPVTPFVPDSSFFGSLLQAIRRAPALKAPGPDSLAADMFRLQPQVFADVLFSLWTSCGRLAYLPGAWREASIVPLYKKGPAEDPANYRPIALLSHARKLIEKAMDYCLRAEYSFHLMQAGFRPKIGTDVALLRTVHRVRTTRPWVAVLDLKSAYDRVPRDRLLSLARQRLSPSLAAMTSLMLQPTKIFTIGDADRTPGLLFRGVPQGSPLSPSLFNMFVDTLAESLALGDAEPADAATLWADDVNVTQPSAPALQQALDRCTQWAASMGMQWNTAPAKSMVLSLPDTEPSTHPLFVLAGAPLHVTPSAEYLGTTFTLHGLTTHKTLERLAAAKKRLLSLVPVGLNRHGWPATISLHVYKTFIRPMFEYALHLLPADPAVTRAIDDLDMTFCGIAFGAWARRHGIRLRKFCRLSSPHPRRICLVTKFRARLEALVTDHAAQSLTEAATHQLGLSALEALAHYEEVQDILSSPSLSPDDLRQLQSAAWDLPDMWRVRHLAAAATLRSLPPVFKLPRTRGLFSLGLQWYFHRFPRRPSQVVHQLGPAGASALRTLCLLQRPALTASQLCQVRAAILLVVTSTT